MNPSDDWAREHSVPTVLEKSFTTFVIVAPLFAIASTPFLWPWIAVPWAMIQAVGWYFLTVAGITLSFHRELTHLSLVWNFYLHYGWAISASLSVEGGPFSWVPRHRKHHKFADRKGDPHSPVDGFLHAHFGWFFKEGVPNRQKYIPHLLEDKGLVLIDKLFPLIAVLSFVLPGFFVWIFEPTLRNFCAGVFWGGFVRVGFVHHVTWCINSFCHKVGERSFRTNDHSTNNRLLGILSMGESYHNNHHGFPWSAKLGLDRGQLDLGWVVICVCRWLGLVTEIKVPTPEQIEAKRIRAYAA